MKLVITKRLLGIPVKVVTVEFPDVHVEVSVDISANVTSPVSLKPQVSP